MEKHLFTCKDCGSHDLIVSHEYTQTRYFTETLACECENSDDEVAATANTHITDSYVAWGCLDDEHRWEEEEEELTDEGDEEKDDYEVFCTKCEKEAQADDWEIEEDLPEIDQDSHEFFVYCGGCDREIEFGWSHPDRAGRIWPSECSDFNPWKCWPEPRYKDKWMKKNWIIPQEKDGE